MRSALALLLLLSLAAVPARAADDPDDDGPELLPEAHVRLLAARYQPVEKDLYWVGWIGGGAGVARWGRTTAGLDTAVETTIGNTRRAFDATQANYHLGIFGRRDFENGSVTLAFHHVSRHLSDTAKTQAVDWNIVGLEGRYRLKDPLPVELMLGVGHTTQFSLVGYKWEIRARADADLVTRDWGAVYGVVDLRGVTVDPQPELPRGSFLDALLEGGLRFHRRGGVLALFAAWEHRNDVLLFEESVRDRALFGVRIDLGMNRSR